MHASSNSEASVRTAASGSYEDDTVFCAMAEIISALCGIDSAQLTPDRRVRDLDIDSLFAGEILAQTERKLDVSLDMRQISDDWSDLTLGELADNFRAGSGHE